MENKAILFAISLCFAGQVHAETVGAGAAAPQITTLSAPSGTDKDENMQEDSESKETPTLLHRRRRAGNNNRIDAGFVKSQLQSKGSNYDSIRHCIVGRLPTEAIRSCMHEAGYCSVNVGLKQENKIPTGSIIVYHKVRLNLTTIAVKLGDQNYYSGSHLQAPLQPSDDRKLTGIFAPPPCK